MIVKIIKRIKIILKEYLFLGLNVVVPLFLGLVIYLVLRPDSYISYAVSRVIPAFENEISVRGGLIQNFGGDFCWAYALMSCLIIVLQNYRIAGILSMFCGILFEIGQLVGIISGTFDIWDIIVEVIACVCAGCFINTYKKRKRGYVS